MMALLNNGEILMSAENNELCYLSHLTEFLQQQIKQLQQQNEWLEEKVCCDGLEIENLTAALTSSEKKNFVLESNLLQHVPTDVQHYDQPPVKKNNQVDCESSADQLPEDKKSKPSILMSSQPKVTDIVRLPSENNAERSDPKQQSPKLGGEKNNLLSHLGIEKFNEKPGYKYVNTNDIKEKMLEFISGNSKKCLNFNCNSQKLSCGYGRNCHFLHAGIWKGQIYVCNLPGIRSFKKQWE